MLLTPLLALRTVSFVAVLRDRNAIRWPIDLLPIAYCPTARSIVDHRARFAAESAWWQELQEAWAPRARLPEARGARSGTRCAFTRRSCREGA